MMAIQKSNVLQNSIKWALITQKWQKLLILRKAVFEEQFPL